MDNNPYVYAHEEYKVSQASIEAGYEVSDMRVKLMVYSVVGLFVMLASGVVFSVIYLRFMESTTASLASKTTYPMSESVEAAKPFPPLQMYPERDQREFLSTAREQLNSFGQVTTLVEDGQGEHVVHAHISIERAMELVASGVAPYRQKPTIALVEESAADEASDGL